jgi:sodium-dependent dicarboxylate transporter 2/3/5
MLGVYKATCAAEGVRKDKALAVFLFLGVCFAANVGGPGSPAAGARNAVMVGFLADAGMPIGFGEWMKYGLPLVPALALTVGAYMYIRCKPNLAVRSVNPSDVVKQQVAQLPRFSGKEALMALVLAGLVIGWMTLHTTLGMGGATLAAVCAMFLFRIVDWDDIQRAWPSMWSGCTAPRPPWRWDWA